MQGTICIPIDSHCVKDRVTGQIAVPWRANMILPMFGVPHVGNVRNTAHITQRRAIDHAALRGSGGVQVHISVTELELQAHADRVGRALQHAGDEVVFSVVDSGRRDEIERVRKADTLVCLVGGVDALRGDGTVPGEWELTAASEQQLPVIAYMLSTADELAERHGRDGYGHARLGRFRDRLRRETELQSYHDPGDLHIRVLRDIEQLRARLRAAAPPAFRAIHRRLRSHADARFDALSLSMQNMDTLYHVRHIRPNSETPSEFHARGPGGAGANTMVALRRLGLATGVVGAVGDDPVGVDLRTSLEGDDVNVSLLLTVDGEESGRGVVIRDDDQNYFNLMSGGANDRLAEVLDRREDMWRVRDALQRSRIVHFSSFGAASELGLQERLAGELPVAAVLSFRPSTLHAEYGADRLEAIFGRCDVLLAGEAELGLLLAKSPAPTGSSFVDRLQALFDWRSRRGYTSPLVVGIYGGTKDVDRQDILTVAWGEETYEGAVSSDSALRLPSSSVLDATGARDAAAAGMLYGLFRGRTPADCANLGSVLATCAMSAFGSRAGLPRSNLVRERWREIMRVHEPPRWLDPYGYAQAGSSMY